jgi:hypothetical protein
MWNLFPDSWFEGAGVSLDVAAFDETLLRADEKVARILITLSDVLGKWQRLEFP